jgi:hypothetical protein
MTRMVLSLVLVGWLIACGGGEESGGEAAADSAAAAPGGLEQTVGAAGRAAATARIAEMRSHLNVIQAAGGDEIVPMVPEHSSMAATLLTELSADPPSNPGWAPLTDSIRADLGRMQNMPANELDQMIDAHAERITRLMQMYEAPR